MNYLQEGLKKLNIETVNLTDLETDLEKYIKELELFNSAYDLTNAENKNDIVIKHVLDSLSAQNNLVSYIKNKVRTDLGFDKIPVKVELKASRTKWENRTRT